MATASLSIPAGPQQNALLRHLRGLAPSFRWALEVRRRCDVQAARGGRLDGEAIRRIVDEADAAVARR